MHIKVPDQVIHFGWPFEFFRNGGKKVLWWIVLIALILLLLILLFCLYCCLIVGKAVDEELQEYDYDKRNRKLSDRY